MNNLREKEKAPCSGGGIWKSSYNKYCNISLHKSQAANVGKEQKSVFPRRSPMLVWRTCLHEGAHAVMAEVHDKRIERIKINSKGKNPYIRFNSRPKTDEDRIHLITIALAGPIAETMIRNVKMDHGRNDGLLAVGLARQVTGEFNSDLEKCQKTRDILNYCFWWTHDTVKILAPAVKRFAEILWREKTLDSVTAHRAAEFCLRLQKSGGAV